MIEILDGIRETIKYQDFSNLLLHHNTDYEDYPSHWHTGLEIIMPQKSYYEVIVEDQAYLLNEGDIIFINSGTIHSTKAPPIGERVIFQFELSLLYNLKEFGTTLFMLPPVLVLYHNEPSDIYQPIYETMLNIVKEYDSKNALKEAYIYSFLIQIYVLLCRKEVYDSEKFRNANTSKQHEYIEKFLFTCDYINKHITENLPLDQVAAIAGFSKYHFSRLFKQFTNVTFYDYLCQRRLTLAQELLMDDELSITEVAMHSGFSSLSTFNRIFKSKNGCSPTEYRNRKVKDSIYIPFIFDIKNKESDLSDSGADALSL